MKLFFAALALLAAGTAHAGTTQDLIKSDSLVHAIVDGVSQKYHVTCDLAGAITRLDCSGDAGCQYTLFVSCPASLGGVSIRMSGYETSSQVGISTVTFMFLR